MARKKKFDTNPLDPEFPQRVTAAAEPAPQETTVLESGAGDTRQFAEPGTTEDQTRKFNQAEFEAYQAPYNGQQVPMSYQPPPQFYAANQRNRKVAKIGLPENILMVLPYLPFHIGLIAGIIELFIVPKSEAKVRFHAAQGVAAQIAIVVISAILHTIGNWTGANFGNDLFMLIATIMLIIFSVKAYQGKPIHIEAVDELTNWLEDKIKPGE